ncbi:MAG: 30S ribosomal protein S5 [Candidatus Micrarchaeaceae archaeon]
MDKKRKEAEQSPPFDVEAWVPLTELGKKVKAHEVSSIEQIFHQGKKIEETEIVDALLPNIKSEVIEIESVQRMTKNNRKQKFRVTAIIGDGNGHVGVGSGKDAEVKAAIESAIKDAKRNVIPIMLGCGSWQCTCGTQHSLPFAVSGRCGGVQVTLKPAPRGTGVVASSPIKKMMVLAGVKDVWSSARGHTKARYNTLMAVVDAMQNMLKMKNLQEG